MTQRRKSYSRKLRKFQKWLAKNFKWKTYLRSGSKLFIRHQRRIGLFIALLGILIGILGFLTDKAENFPFVQSLMLSKEYKIQKPLQKLLSGEVVNYQSEGFSELSDFTKEEILFHRKDYTDEQKKMLETNLMISANPNGTVMTEKGWLSVAVFRSVCCTYQLDITVMNQKIEQRKKDFFFKLTVYFFIIGTVITLAGIFIGYVSPEQSKRKTV